MEAPTEDIIWIERLLNGEKQALYYLYDKYSGALYGVILRMCKREDLAQDLLQETFLKVWKNIGSYDPGRGKFYTWSYRIAKNTTLNALRKDRKLIQTEDLSVYKDRSAERVEKDFSELNGTLKKLEPHHQRVIELVYFRGMTHREGHQEMGIPLGTFKSYVRQAIKQLRTKYDGEFMMVLWCLEAMANG